MSVEVLADRVRRLQRELKRIEEELWSLFSLLYDVISPQLNFEVFYRELDSFVKSRFEEKFGKWYLRYYFNGRYRSVYVGDDSKRERVEEILSKLKDVYYKKQQILKLLDQVEQYIELFSKKIDRILGR